MADATDLKFVDRKVVRVRLPPPAPIISLTYRQPLITLTSHNGVKSVAAPIFAQSHKKTAIARADG